MARPGRDAIELFMSITGAPEALAVRKLEENGGDLNQAVNSHFTEGDRTVFSVNETSAVVPQDDFMDIEDHRTQDISQQNEHGDVDHSSHDIHTRPTASVFDDMSDYDIEEEMVRAAIEASKRGYSEHNDLSNSGLGSQFPMEDAELARAVSLSITTAEQENALRERTGKSTVSMVGASSSGSSEENLGNKVVSAGRFDAANSSVHEEAKDLEDQVPTENSSRCALPGPLDAGVIEAIPPSSTGQDIMDNHPRQTRYAFQSNEWGGMSSEEHDEAVMLEAAMLGGIPERPGYHLPYAPHQLMPSDRSYPQQIPRPPSPSLEAERLIRELQDDEYLASLQADQVKELRAKAEAEARRLQEETTRAAALEEERQREEENRRKLEEEQELERQLVAKEASLPEEPAADDENAIKILVRMPDGSRHGRRFLKSDKLQWLYDFLDIGGVVKSGSYRLVRPYPRRAFSDGEHSFTLSELGLTSKKEALFLELI